MVLPDTNLLVYAYTDESPFHTDAQKWWEDLISSGVPVFLPWAVIISFVRLISNPRIVQMPSNAAEAMQTANDWLNQRSVQIIDPGEKHSALLIQFLKHTTAGSKLVMDAHIAALAVEYDLTIYTNDTDFQRFPGVKSKNPLISRHLAP